MTASSVLKVTILSWLSAPVSYGVNRAIVEAAKYGYYGSGFIFILAIPTLLLVAFINYVAFKNTRITDYFFYGFLLFAFTSTLDLIIGLELDGFISGFMGTYLKEGEPYLSTPYGAIICYWDGTGIYLMYLIMMAAIIYGKCYRKMALYWSAHLVNSLVVLFLAIFTSKAGAYWSTLLNVPYLLFPLCVASRALSNKPEMPKKIKPSKALYKRPIDIILVLFSIGSITVIGIKGLGVLGSTIPSITRYIYTAEPYLMQTELAAFGRSQALVDFFYFLPIYLLEIYGLLIPSNSWMLDLTILHAGAASQAQIAYIGSSVHPRTPAQFRISSHQSTQVNFWVINLTLAVLPHVIAYRANKWPDFFTSIKPVGYKLGAMPADRPAAYSSTTVTTSTMYYSSGCT